MMDGMPSTLLRDVESASIMIRRYYRTVKETMRSMSGYLVRMQCWAAKKMLAKHIWMDALHADMLRARALDLRYPRIDVEDNYDQHLIRTLEKMPSVESDEQFLICVYRVVKPSLLNSLRSYLAGSDALDDAPSHFYFKRIIGELELELEEFEAVWNERKASPSTEADDWLKTFSDIFQACGGVSGPDHEEVSESFVHFMSKPNYTLPMEGGREASWEPAVMQVPPRAPRNMLERRIWIAIDHANEVWAAETAAALIWEYKQMPWELYLDAARWCYDEMRHAMMGEQRLVAMGLQIGVDYPMVPDHWRTFRKNGIGTLLILLHGLEQSGPLNKARFKKELYEVQDYEGAQDCDYDWADESGHISYGLAWIKALYPKWSKEQIMAETNRLLQEWREWIERHHTEGKHGYEKFLERMEMKIG